jgi:phage shock protein A
MGIFDRMGRVISSNVNALLDKADDPRKSIDLLVSEMKDQVRAAQKEVVATFATQKQLQKKVDDLDAEAEKWASRAELALKADDETLAREALVQKKRVVGERDRAEALLAESRGSIIRMKQELARMEQKQQELEARKGTIAVQAQRAKAGSGAESLGAQGGTSAFDTFREYEAKIDRTEAEAQAHREVEDALDPGKAAGGLSRDELEAKFAQLEGRAGSAAPGAPKGTGEIDDELAALKKRIRISLAKTRFC